MPFSAAPAPEVRFCIVIFAPVVVLDDGKTYTNIRSEVGGEGWPFDGVHTRGTSRTLAVSACRITRPPVTTSQGDRQNRDSSQNAWSGSLLMMSWTSGIPIASATLYLGGSAKTYLEFRPNSPGPNGAVLTTNSPFSIKSHCERVKTIIGISWYGFASLQCGFRIAILGPRSILVERRAGSSLDVGSHTVAHHPLTIIL